MKSRSILQIFLLSAVWGISFLMIRVAGSAFPPLWIALLRCSLGAALMWTVLSLAGKQLPPRRLLPWLLTVAFFNNALPFTFFAWGERTVPSNIAAVINATTPIWTLLLTMAIYRTRAALLTIGGVLLAFGGVLIVVLSHAGEHPADAGSGGMIRGSIIIALAALGYAIATVIAKAKLKGLDPIGLATTQLSLGAVMLFPIALAGARPSNLHLAPLAAIAVLGFAGSGLAYLLYYHLLSQVSATQVAAVTYVLPLWGLAWGFLAHESISLSACLGVAVTIVGLVVLNLPPRLQPLPVPLKAQG